MRFSVITIFPEFFDSPLKHGLLDKAIDSKKVRIDILNLRDFAKGKHRQTDDTPYGGGPGMVMMPGPLAAAINHARKSNSGSKVVALSPGGTPLNNHKAKTLAKQKGLILVCGRYEGIDQRIIDHYCDEEISIGDYVLTGGEPAALILIDAVSRMLPGVIGDPESVSRDSFSNALSHPQYTRPRNHEGYQVPEALFSGDHEKIRQWRENAAWERTRKYRPDLLAGLAATRFWLIINEPTLEVFPDYMAMIKSYRLGGALFVIPNTQKRNEARTIIENQKRFSNSKIFFKRSVSDAVRWLEKKEGAFPEIIRIGFNADAKATARNFSSNRISNKNIPAALYIGSTYPSESSKYAFFESNPIIVFEEEFLNTDPQHLALLALDRVLKNKPTG